MKPPRLKPLSKENQALLDQAAQLESRNALPQALSLYETLLKQCPKNSLVLGGYATVLLKSGRHRQALVYLEKSLALDKTQAGLYCNMGIALKALKQPQAAIDRFNQAIALNPQLASAYGNRGNILKELERYAEALDSLDQAIALNPREADFFTNRGAVLRALERYEEAELSYDQALLINPYSVTALYNRGNVKLAQRRYPDAVADYRLALQLDPRYAAASYNCGNALQELCRFQEALRCYDQAVNAKPNYPEAQWNRALLLILLGRYREGWPLYEWRFDHPQLPASLRFDSDSRYTGQDLTGKTLFLYPEQGLGDTIMFSRFAKLLAAQAGKVIMEVLPPLVGLLATLDDSIETVAYGGEPPPFDYQCPLLSLAEVFAITVETVPLAEPYLQADPQKIGFWRAQLPERRLPRVGLVWAGSKTHLNDQVRSIPPSCFADLLSLPLEFHCLQKQLSDADAEFCAAHRNLSSHAALLEDFTDTAALIAEMDLVISVDTSVAHLAGAMGKPVWILLPFIPDYRWLLERTDSPWYASAALYRQDGQRDWPAVLGRVKADLADRFLDAGGGSRSRPRVDHF